MRARKEAGFFSKCLKYEWANLSMKKVFSVFFMVLIMNYLSWLKKKKLPLAPLDSPALKTFERFISGERDLII